MSQAPRSGAYRDPWQGREPEFYGASGGAPGPGYDEVTQHRTRASRYNAGSRAEFPRTPHEPGGRSGRGRGGGNGRDPRAGRERDAGSRDRDRGPARRPGGDGRRSGPPPGRRPPIRWGSLSGRQGVGIVIGSAALGAVGTMLTSGGPGMLLSVCLVAGTVAAGLVVRQREAYLIIPVPALAYLVAALTAGLAGSGAGSVTDLAVNALQWVAHGFGTMLLATILAIGITAARWWMAVQRAGLPRRQGPQRAPGDPRRGGSGYDGGHGARANPGRQHPPDYQESRRDEPQPPDRPLLGSACR